MNNYDCSIFPYKYISFPVLCKNNSYAESTTGRKIEEESAIEGNVKYISGGKRYANQKLKSPLYVDYTWCDGRNIYFVIYTADAVNKHGLKWKLVFNAKFTPWVQGPKCEGSYNINYWIGKGQELLKNRPKLQLSDHIPKEYALSEIDIAYWFGKGKKGVFVVSTNAILTKWINGGFDEEYAKFYEHNGIKSRRFGIELEFTGISRDTSARTVAQVLGCKKTYIGGVYNVHQMKDKYNRTWMILRDASISPQVTARRQNPELKNYKCELVSPILEYKDIPLLTKIIRALKNKGAVVNESCGMHVHVDVQEFTPRQIRNIVNLTATKQELLYKALNVSDGRSTHWCKRINWNFIHEINTWGTKFKMQSLKEAWYEGVDNMSNHYNVTRYQCLNLHSFFENKGVEFRFFNASLIATEVKSYIILSLAICSTASVRNSCNRPRYGRIIKNQKKRMISWLYQLGLTGAQFKDVRANLIKYLGDDEIEEVA